jgi:hypothetical protein
MASPDSLTKALDSRSTPSPQLWALEPWLSRPEISTTFVFAHPKAGKDMRRARARLRRKLFVFLFIADFECLNYEEMGIVLKEYNQTSRIALRFENTT